MRHTRALGQTLLDVGVPIVTPPGRHAIFRFLRGRFEPLEAWETAVPVGA